MSFIKNYLKYSKDNPGGYWFKRKLYGWGWVPVRREGWFVVLFCVGIIAVSVYIGEIDDAPGTALIGILVAIVLMIYFGYKRGEKPRWQWGKGKK